MSKSKSRRKAPDIIGAVKKLPAVLLIFILAAGIALTALMEAGILNEDVIESVVRRVWSPRIRSSQEAPENTLARVTVLDVGQGDCILIESEKTVLIDSGETEYAGDVMRFIRSRGIKRLDTVIVTHQHTDHMGGMSEIIEGFDIGRIIMPEVPEEMLTPSFAYENMLTAADEKGLHFTPARAGHVMELSSDGMTKLTIQYPTADTVMDDLNDYSVVCRLECGDTSFLFMGDLTEKGEEMMLEQMLVEKTDVLKVGHHGSSYSSSRAFLAKLRPSLAVISVGKDNEYGHPAEDTLKRLGRYAKIVRTDETGDIILYSDGESVSVTGNKDTDSVQ